MNIDDWVKMKNNNQDILGFIKENPDEIYEVLVHYQVNCNSLKYKMKNIKFQKNMLIILIVIAFILNLLCVMID